METSGVPAWPLAITACYQMQNGMQLKVLFVAVARDAGETNFLLCI
jgi:hypothetical protein